MPDSKSPETAPIIVAERQNYTRIAAYTAQIITSIANGLDEQQIDHDID